MRVRGLTPKKSATSEWESILFLLQLELRCELLLRLRRHRRVVAELDRVRALSSSHRTQARLVRRDFGQRHEALDRHEVAARGFGPRHLSAFSGKVRGEVADETIGRRDLDVHDRL